MKHIVQQKFKQHPPLQDALVNTGANALIEATYDKYWGSGLPLTARNLRDGKWTGRNCLGVILNDIRTEIKRERAAASLSNPMNNNGQAINTSQGQITESQIRVTPTRSSNRRPTQPPPKPPQQLPTLYPPATFHPPPSQGGLLPPQSSPPPLMSNISYPRLHNQSMQSPAGYSQNPPLLYSQAMQIPANNDAYIPPNQPHHSMYPSYVNDTQELYTREQSPYSPNTSVLSPNLGAFGYQSQQYFSQPSF